MKRSLGPEGFGKCMSAIRSLHRNVGHGAITELTGEALNLMALVAGGGAALLPSVQA